MLQFSEMTGYTLTEGQNSVPAKSQEFADAFCPTGDVVVGGGSYCVNQGLEADINSSAPDSDGTAWTVFINHKSSTKNCWWSPWRSVPPGAALRITRSNLVHQPRARPGRAG